MGSHEHDNKPSGSQNVGNLWLAVGLLASQEGNFSMEPASHLNKETSPHTHTHKKGSNLQANVEDSSLSDKFWCDYEILFVLVGTEKQKTCQLEDFTVTGILWVTDLREVFKFYQQPLNNSIYIYVNYNLRNTVHHEE